MCECHCRFLEETIAVMKLAPHEHAQTVEFLHRQFINKVVDDRVEVQRQVPQSKWRWDETVEDLRRARYSQTGCCRDCQRNGQSLVHPVRVSKEHLSRLDQAGNGDAKRKPSDANMRRSLQSEKDQQNELSLARGKQPDCDNVEHHSPVQDPDAHAQPKQKRTRDHQACLRRCRQKPRKPKEAKNFIKSEAKMVDVMDTLQRTISTIEKEIGQEPYILAEGDRHTEHEQRHGTAHHEEDLNVNRLQQTVSMMRRTTEQITDVSCGNTAALVGIEQFL